MKLGAFVVVLAISTPSLARLQLRWVNAEVHCAAGAWHGRGLVCYASSGKEGNRRLPGHALYDLRSGIPLVPVRG